MIRRLQLLATVPQQGLQIRLAMQKCLNDQFSHKCTHRIMWGGKLSPPTFLGALHNHPNSHALAMFLDPDHRSKVV